MKQTGGEGREAKWIFRRSPKQSAGLEGGRFARASWAGQDPFGPGDYRYISKCVRSKSFGTRQRHSVSHKYIYYQQHRGTHPFGSQLS